MIKQKNNRQIKSDLLLISNLLFIFLLTTSCKDNNTSMISEINNQTLTPKVNLESTNIDGVWVRKDYINNLKKNNSPNLSFQYLDGISSLEIYQEKKTKKVALNLNTVEGAEATIIIYNNDYFLNFFWNGENQRSKINYKNNEISFLVNSRLLTFVKVNNQTETFGINDIANEVLFQNKNFNCYDDKNNLIANNVKFKNNGSLINFLNFSTYEVETSFVVYENPKDLIVLKNTKKGKSEVFHFKLLDKKILLYEIKILKDTIHEIDDEDYQDKEGLKLKYTLKGI